MKDDNLTLYFLKKSLLLIKIYFKELVNFRHHLYYTLINVKTVGYTKQRSKMRH